jgi:hypothetical protein
MSHKPEQGYYNPPTQANGQVMAEVDSTPAKPVGKDGSVIHELM